MLIPCPECAREVSDRARACPGCGFPVVEHLAEQRASADRAARLASRERTGEVDCPHCEARGFRMLDAKDEDGEVRQVFSWCVHCDHSGRVHQCRDTELFYAVSLAALERFIAGEIDERAEEVVVLGDEVVAEHRYAEAGERWGEVAPDDGDDTLDASEADPGDEAGDSEAAS